MAMDQLPLTSTVEIFHGEAETPSMTSRRSVRVALVMASACALLAVAGFMMKGEEGSSTELMWGGPLSFDMVHTHILNMKMRRSRLKEKLKQAALKRKDREIAQEHGFNSQGNIAAPAAPQQQMMQMQAPPAPQYAPPAPQYEQPPMQAPQMYQQPPQMYQQQPPAPQFQPQQFQPQQFQGAPAPAPQFQAPQYQQLPQQQPPMYGQPAPQFGAPPQEPGYPPAPQFQAPPEAPQLAQMGPPPSNPWGGMTVSAAPSPAVPVSGPTESSSDDKDQQRAQAAASIQAYEQFMHGGAPAAKPAGPGGAQGMMMHA